MKKFLFAFMFIFAVTAKDLLPTLPSIEGIDRGMKERCLKNADTKSYNIAMNATEVFKKCLTNQMPPEELQRGMLTGDQDTLLRNYCRMYRTSIVCGEPLLKASKPCWGENKMPYMSLAVNVSDALLNFLCVEEGAKMRLSSFVAEGGAQCLESKREQIQSCLNGTLRPYIVGLFSENIPPPLLLDEKQCGDIERSMTCAVQHFKKCARPTPANMFERLFDVVKENTPCKKSLANAAVSMSKALPSNGTHVRAKEGPVRPQVILVN